MCPHDSMSTPASGEPQRTPPTALNWTGPRRQTGIRTYHPDRYITISHARQLEPASDRRLRRDVGLGCRHRLRPAKRPAAARMCVGGAGRDRPAQPGSAVTRGGLVTEST